MNDSERTAKAREQKMNPEAITERIQLAYAAQKELCAEINRSEDGEFGLGLFDVLQEMYNAGYAFDESERASATKEAREECCRAVCDCCGKYAQYWNPAELVNERWRHISKKVPDEGKPTTHLCGAAAIRALCER